MKILGKTVFGTTLVSAMMFLGVCNASAQGIKSIMKFHQAAPELSTLDAGQAGRSPGDIVAFEATVKSENGETAHLNGYDVILDVAGDAEPVEDRFTYVVVEFEDNSTMIVAGKSTYSPTSAEISNGLPQVRAVIGGTGKYIGASGQVTTVRNQDGSYDHTVELLDQDD